MSQSYESEMPTGQEAGKKVDCPTCGEKTTELYICSMAGCQYAKKAGCELHYRWSDMGWRCANGHAAKKVWP